MVAVKKDLKEVEVESVPSTRRRTRDSVKEPVEKPKEVKQTNKKEVKQTVVDDLDVSEVTKETEEQVGIM